MALTGSRASFAALLVAATASAVAGQPALPAGPGPYDPAVPTVAALRGFETGTGFSTYRDVERVLEGIAAASARVSLETYGTTPEGRALRLAWVSSPANLVRLAELRAANRRLLDPADPGDSGAFPEDHPIFVWLSFGVHGDEASSPEAALELLYHLAAAEDAGTLVWLDRAVVVIDPLLNPDGHERYVTWYRSVAGPMPNPDPGAREHRPPWPRGRTNHWYFDLNRDWAWGVQPETRARRAAYLATLPQVHVDFHEMDPASTYFFFPPAAPIHAMYPPSTRRWGRVFGEANARAFDARGWPYYTEEDFDLFYPGYGDSWPSFYGATGMTYEQAGGGSAGIVLDRRSGDRLTLADRVEHHLVSALTTIATAVEHRRARLEDFIAFWRGPGRAPTGSPAAYLLPGDDPDALALAGLLASQGVAIDTLAAAIPAREMTIYPHATRNDDLLAPGTLLVRGDQPLARYLAALMAPAPALPDTSLFYDITGWSLPYLFDVVAWHAAAVPAAPAHPWDSVATRTSPPVPDVTVAFAWPYASFSDVLAAARLASAGWRLRVAERGFTVAGRRYAPGAFVLRMGEQADSLPRSPAAVAAAIADAGARPEALNGFRTDDGVDLGSDRVRPIRVPRVALAAGPGVSPASLGAARWLLEAEVGLPIDVVRLGDLAARPEADKDSLAGLDRMPLTIDEYTAIVLPDGPDATAYAAALGAEGRDRLAAWVDAGGTLIGVRAGAAYLSQGASAMAEAALAAEPEPTDPERRMPAAVREESDRWSRIPGTLVAAEVDTTSPLGWGYPDGRAAVLVRDPVEFMLADRGNAWIYRDQDPLAGYLPEAARRRLPGTPWAILERRGRGHLVLFADDPGFRGIVHGLKKVYLNAILLVPE